MLSFARTDAAGAKLPPLLQVCAEAVAAATAAVEAAVARLTVEFQKRERMLLTAVAAHAERERELQDRLEALERRLETVERAASHRPDPQPPADPGDRQDI